MHGPKAYFGTSFNPIGEDHLLLISISLPTDRFRVLMSPRVLHAAHSNLAQKCISLRSIESTHLMDSSGSVRHQRRTSLTGREHDRYKVEIAALSETRLVDEGLLKGAGYTFFWSGRKKEERREAVGFAIKSHLVNKLSGFQKGINDCLMTLPLPLSGKRHAAIVSAYAPTMTNPDEVKDKFYDDLDSVISAAPQADKLILLGDFNARGRTDHQTWDGVIRILRC